MKHTPGPWRILTRAIGTVANESGRVVATCMGYTTNTDNGEHIQENIANATLIAAAPELLAALESLQNCMVARSTVEGDLPWTSDVVAAMESARCAISKAVAE